MSKLRTLQDRARARLGTVLKDKWRLESLLGLGGTAAVYLATHRNGNRAAIKLIHPEHCANDELYARFIREGIVTNRVDHPGVPVILDDDRTDDGGLFFVMELLEGCTLQDYTRAPNLLPVRRVLELTDQVLDILA